MYWVVLCKNRRCLFYLFMSSRITFRSVSKCSPCMFLHIICLIDLWVVLFVPIVNGHITWTCKSCSIFIVCEYERCWILCKFITWYLTKFILLSVSLILSSKTQWKRNTWVLWNHLKTELALLLYPFIRLWLISFV